MARGDEASNLNGSGAPAEAPAAEPPSKSARGRTAAADAANARAARKAVESAIKVANVAAGALATLAKDNIVNQMMITEEGGIQPLVDLLKTKADSYENPTKALWHLATTEDNQTAIAKAGGIAPLVSLLTSPKEMTAQYASAALRTLAREHPENQIALAKAGAIAPLVDLLGSDSQETQEHSVGALLHLASQDVASRNAVVLKLVAVLNLRNAAAQMKAAEALAVLAGRSDENRKAITAANAIEPLVRLLGDGRRVRAKTPQERAAAVLSNLARSGDNKKAIVEAGSVASRLWRCSSDAPRRRPTPPPRLPTSWRSAPIGRSSLARAPSSHSLLCSARLRSTPRSTPLARSTTSRAVPTTRCRWPTRAPSRCSWPSSSRAPRGARARGGRRVGPRSHAGRQQEGALQRGRRAPLVFLLSDLKPMTQRHAACALWGLCDGKDGVYDKHIAEAGAIPLLIAMLQNDDIETRGFAVACLSASATTRPPIPPFSRVAAPSCSRRSRTARRRGYDLKSSRCSRSSAPRSQIRTTRRPRCSSSSLWRLPLRRPNRWRLTAAPTTPRSRAASAAPAAATPAASLSRRARAFQRARLALGYHPGCRWGREAWSPRGRSQAPPE